MPICPHCKKFTSFAEYGIDNILEGQDAIDFRENEKTPATPDQIAFFKEALKVYRKSVEDGRFKP